MTDRRGGPLGESESQGIREDADVTRVVPRREKPGGGVHGGIAGRRQNGSIEGPCLQAWELSAVDPDEYRQAIPGYDGTDSWLTQRAVLTSDAMLDRAFALN